MRISFTGYQRYVRELMADAGLIDPELEALVDEAKAVDKHLDRIERFFGGSIRG